ncbi:PREDICTED: putative HVA22-like protein g [Tarenaya hassleriana]|uniref:putative HVA22-like protein g n=1 Tax=Tarenaya hassleriana TaxID=28532 RepID=UPI00053C8916|nr:PREDICTED: putative HVA22-like protein g [Tarenaya hassleriana]
MIGSFLTRGLTMVFGYAYPAYECYKTVEQNKPEIQQLRFWCQYWILVAVLTVCERVGDAFVSWVPMYSEAKLAFFIYLWYPKTRGTTYIYGSFFRPYVAKHENEIDRNLIELRTRAGDMVVLYCQRAVTFGQTRFFEILQFIAEQSTPKPRSQKKQPTLPASSAPEPPQQQAPKASQPPNNPPIHLPSKKSQPLLSKEPLSPKPTSSPWQKQQQTEIVETKPSPSQNKATPPPSPSPSLSTTPKVKNAPSPPEKPAESAPTETEASQIVAASSNSADKRSVLPSSKESIMEETIRVTRGRLRKARSTGTR